MRYIAVSKLYTALLVAMTQTRTENNKRFPRRIRLDLVNWVARIVDTVRHGPYERNSAHPGETPGPSQETESLLWLRGRGWSRSSGVSVGTTSGALKGLLEAIGSQRPGRPEDLARRLNARHGRQAHSRR